MNEIKIAYLYYDICNIFGESYNIDALEKYISLAKGKSKTYKLSIKDKIDFNKYDVFYLCSSRKYDQNLILNDLMKYESDIKKAIKRGALFIVIGNSMELFGNKIRTSKGKSIYTLGTYPYQTKEEKNWIVTDCFYDYDILKKHSKIISLKSKNTNIVRNDSKRMFLLSDSFNDLNFFAMELVGPILVRNPYFTIYLVKRLFEYKGIDFYNFDKTIEMEAYELFVDRYITNNSLD